MPDSDPAVVREEPAGEGVAPYDRAAPSHGRLRGYVEVGGASVVNGSIGTMVSYATMPASMLLVVRMTFAAVALGGVVVPRRLLGELRGPGIPLRVLGISATLALNLLLYFLAIRATGVSVAIFLSYLAPVYLAVVAPLVFGERTERAVYFALVVALAGMAMILVPGLAGARFSALGLLYAWGAGVMYAVYLLFAKSLRRRRVPSTAVVFVQSVFTALVLLPLGLYEVVGRYTPTVSDLAMGLLLGVVTTAFSFSVFMHGLRYIKVQHAPIMGYLEPVSAPLYAFVLLGERPAVWTLAGGALIVVAGLLVVLFGGETQPELQG
jgi:drug/metabolite transporter (DMT)-like permease